MLELIVRQPDRAAKATPLLFIHGAWHGAWCWDEYFLPYFTQHGYASYALSLRGHGKSPGQERLRWTRLSEYVEDVAQVVAQMPLPPVLIGHSMGGFVVQKYLEKYSAAAAILIASVPPTGVIKTTLNIARHHPLTFLKLNLKMSLYPLVATPQMAQQHFFSATMPDIQVEKYHQQLQDESYLGFLDMLLLNRVKTKRVKRIPMLVLGGANDTLFTNTEVAQTAAAYNTTAHIFPDTAHDVMLETNWKAAADYILNWLANNIGG